MKKTIVLSLVLALIAGALTSPAAAGKKKKKKKPQDVTLFLHGIDEIGEAEYVNTGGFQKMDSTEPSSGTPKSRSVTNYVLGPNTECSGNALLPTWQGPLSGKVTGDLTIFLNTAAHPAAQISVELYADGTGGCNQSTLGAADYIPPVAETIVDVPPGAGITEVVFEDVSFKTIGSLVLMLHAAEVAAGRSPHQTRVFYDAPDFASRIELTCIPSGKTCN